MSDDDGALLRHAGEGRAETFAALFDRHVDRVHRHARRLAPTEADAEDVTAATFLEAWRLRRRIRIVDGSAIAWLLVTATNVARNASRSRRRHERMLRALHVDDAPDHADAVLDRIGRERFREPLRLAFDGLSRGDQEVLALCVIEELRPREVAAMMRVPSATIRTRLNRAKRRLRDALEALGGAEDWREA